MKGAVIVNRFVGHNAYKIARFQEEFGKKGVCLDVYQNDGTLASIKDGKAVTELPAFDFVIYLDKDIYLARLLEKAGYRLFNSPDFIRMCDDKMQTEIACSGFGFAMPETYTAPLVYKRELADDDYAFLGKIGSKLGYPLIVKEHFGSLGTGVYLAKDETELREIYRDHFTVPLLFQKYVATSKGKSVRVLIIDKKVFGAFVRYNGEDFRSNFGETASSKSSGINEKYIGFAGKIAEKMNIEYAGIDLLFGENDEPVLCEINSNAFFEEFEKVTGLNVAGAVCDMIIRKIGCKQNEQEQKTL